MFAKPQSPAISTDKADTSDSLMTPPEKKLLFLILIAGSLLAALKTIFVSLHIDEEYQITMGYRLLRGEKLFADLWDPHQTSAFLTEFLMWIFEKIFSSLTGVVIWIRFCGTLIHLSVSYQVYRVLKNYVSGEYSFYLCLLYFNLLPKNSVLPDYSLMFVWTLTLLLIHLFWLDQSKNLIHAVLCGFWMCVMVLSYPSSVLLFPMIFFLLLCGKEYGKKFCLIFSCVCLAGAFFYLLRLITLTGSLSGLIGSLSDLLKGQSEYTQLSFMYKTMHYLREFLIGFLICGVYCLIAWLCLRLLSHFRKFTPTKAQFFYLSLAVGTIHHILHWILMLRAFEQAYNYVIYFLVFAILFFVRDKLAPTFKKTALIWAGASLAALLCVLILTDLTVYASCKYMIPGYIMGICALMGYSAWEDPRTYQKHSRKLLLLLCFSAIFIKVWQYPANAGVMFNITSIRGIIKEGPAKGILTEYMTSYIAHSTYTEMEEYIPEGSTLFILDGSSLGYLYRNAEVSSYTTISPPQYNEILLHYWDDHPEKYPDVIAVTCWYGELHWDPESWIMQWIGNDYQASRIIDGKYYRYYFR